MDVFNAVNFSSQEKKLTQRDYFELAKYVKAKSVKAGEFVCREGEKTSALYVVLKGSLSLC